MGELTYKSQRFLELVQLAVDGALRPDEETTFFKQINSCQQCLDTYYKEKGYKQFISNKMNNRRVHPSADLISRIKSNIGGDPASA